jgi:hypothetical protein
VVQPSPPEASSGPVQRAGLALPLAIFRDPAGAFALIAATREWLPAYLLIVALDLAALYLSAPALAHVARLLLRPGTSAADVQQAVSRWVELQVVWTVVGPFVLWGFVATLLAALAIVARGPAPSFAMYFSLCMNCALPAQIGEVVYAVATRLRDPASFHTLNDLATVLPLSLAAFRPHGSPPEIAFLSYWDVFTLWALVLLGCGYASIAKVRLVPALLLALGIGVAIALTQVASGP